MSPKVELIAKDIFPRFLGIALIAVMAWIVTSYMNKSDEDTWKREISNYNNRAVEAFSGTLDRRLASAENLARDNRFDPILDPSFNSNDPKPASARRAMYEFKYINEIDHAYIYSSILGEIVLSTAGSPPLPAGTLTPFYNAANQQLERLTNLTMIGGQTYMLFAKAISGDTGRIIGYAIYTDTLKSFYRDASTPLRGIKHVEFSSYLIEGSKALSVSDYSKHAGSARIVHMSESVYPIFDGNFGSKKFTLADKSQKIAAGNFVVDIPKWRIIAEVDMKHVLADSGHKKAILLATIALGTLIIMMIPITGPYSEALRELYQKAGIISADKQKRHGMDVEDINRMRLDPAPAIHSSIDKTKQELNKKINQERTKTKDDYRPSDAVIAYNIRTGIKNRRMKLLYQPVFDSKSNKVLMYEVYLRIVDEDGKVMAPSLWLPVAKKENLFSLIDETVVSIAVEKFFAKDNPIKQSLAFNISGSTFGSLEFLEKLMKNSATKHHIAEHTIFELRSREIIEDKRAMTFIKECREMGFRFSIDYFGGGPQTLKAAKTLKFDFVKIDILRFDLRKPADQKELIKLIKTAEAIDLPVIIEKIEDEKMLRFCKKVGADCVQGYHLAEPNVDLLK